ncbi:MAG TPA: M28 family peptidase [Candidatus Eisenbacteria bacterium]
MRNRRLIPPAAMAALFLAAGPSSLPVRPAHAAPADPITAGELSGHVRTLASDEFAGRGTGEAGGEMAARYIADAFKAAGVQPAGDNGGWYQEFPAKVASSLGDGNAVTLPTKKLPHDLELGKEFVPLAFSASGECAAPAIFVGYGITAAEHGYDDYAGLDVSGKVVVCLRYEPARDDTGSIFEGRKDTWHANLRTKARNAETHGAAGIIIVNGPLNEGGADDLLTWEKAGTAQAVGIPAMMITRKGLESIWGLGLPDKPASLKDLQGRIDGEMRPLSQPITSMSVRLKGDIRTETRTTRNVVAWLPPNGGAARMVGRADSTSEPHLVIGAHYDHLGMGGQHSLSPDKLEVHNGADDNASGTAGLLELAEAMASDPTPRTQGVVFAAFGAEELGLFGSAWYVDHPVRPIDGLTAMLNMDMIGRLKNGRLEVGGVGTSPPLKGLVEAAWGGTGVTPVYSEGGSGPSDHKTFNDRKRPVLFFFTGVHEDYHRPSDDWEKINSDGMAEVTEGIRKIAMQLAGEAAPLPWTAVAADTTTRLGAVSGSGASLGTIPDYTESDIPGLKLSGVRAGGPAEKAGIQGGDIIVGFDGRVVRNIYDLMEELGSHRPGDTVVVEVLRQRQPLDPAAQPPPEPERLKLTATLERRK